MNVPTGAGNYPPGVSDNDPYFDLPSLGDDEDEPHQVPCSYPGCQRLTTRDPIYDDLCYEHIRADNE